MIEVHETGKIRIIMTLLSLGKRINILGGAHSFLMNKLLHIVILTISLVLTMVVLFNVTTAFILPSIFPQAMPENPLFPQSAMELPEEPLAGWRILYVLYESTPYLAPIAWGFLAALAWKGKIRWIWSRRGYDYDQFKLVSRMRGSSNRVQILESLFVPKTKLQLAKELSLDWKTVDNHINVLMGYNFVNEVIYVGTSKYLVITEKGKEIPIF